MTKHISLKIQNSMQKYAVSFCFMNIYIAKYCENSRSITWCDIKLQPSEAEELVVYIGSFVKYGHN